MPLTIENLLSENRVYPPPAGFAEAANVDAGEYDRAAADPVAFWERQAGRLDWAERWHTAHTWEPALPLDGPLAGPGAEPGADGQPLLSIPAAEWFVGGRLNVAVNCVDRHVDAGQGDTVAIHFEGEPGDRETITYADLQRRVARAANALEALGIVAGDRVVVYLPVIPETIVITLAIAHIGAIHSLVFGGFSAEALKFRVEDTGAKLLVTSDGQFRRGAAVAVKANADEAVSASATIEHVLVVRRTGDLTPDIPWQQGRDVWFHDAIAAAPDTHAAQNFDSEHPLFIIYTSGTTGRPKGVVHTSAGYLTQASWSHWAAFDAKPTDVYWCTADLAWVTAHTYVLYGPFSNGATSVIYEGTPNTPHTGRHFEIIERYGVTTYYTAPTLIRTFMTWFPDGLPPRFDLSTLRLLGTVGEAINPEAWVWFHQNVGGGRAPIVDTWWQSETGAAVIAPLPGVTVLKPGSATFALPGITVRIVDEQGVQVPNGSGGYLVIDGTWPAMARGVWGDPQRFRDSYWKKYAAQGYFFAGDGAKYDADGYIWLLGRVDDVINVSGHRLSTIEIESALVSHPSVGEAGVVGVTDPVTGEAIAAFVIPSRDVAVQDAGDPAFWASLESELSALLRAHVSREIGPIAKPRDLIVVPDLPKTRSGKIMRRLLGDLVDGRTLGDTTSLQDESVPSRIAAILGARGR
ncbi:acetate--CoA ligase [Subtercola boreus]|uniref:Acetate--CoA ligase n=1 Tax=Subtercola boreus TaxID=120213 RepID=A0A3E0W6C2_9MICO|nr:acetate--CoA ligase [Subtercola boreus]RFA18021.1 acetate--CoA ligase [Subtercola boreus]RFA18403.1 acetate--CoA ligase [Subtercola boreus]RFA24932.1 acetate--CoA ligase [Subtercola boreus]